MVITAIDTLMHKIGVRGNFSKYNSIPDGEFYKLVDNPKRGTKKSYIEIEEDIKEKGIREFLNNYIIYTNSVSRTIELIDKYLNETFHSDSSSENDEIDDYLLILEKYGFSKAYIEENLEAVGEVLKRDEYVFRAITKMIEKEMSDKQINYELEFLQKPKYAKTIIEVKKKKVLEYIKKSDNRVSNEILRILNKKIISHQSY